VRLDYPDLDKGNIKPWNDNREVLLNIREKESDLFEIA
jgi:hypothetical protein